MCETCLYNKNCQFLAKHKLEPVVSCTAYNNAADMVEVVRCKDCKHWGTECAGETDRIKECEYAHYMTGANGYCVYGERREDDA